MAKRKGMSKRTRFEVFKRDSFECQYCGRSAPSVILHIDHIHPVSEGGTDDMINLITACADCNGGKSNVVLSDDSAVSRQRAHMKSLAEKREQTQMMIAWRKELQQSEDAVFDYVLELVNDNMDGVTLNEVGEKRLRTTVKKYPLDVLSESIAASASQYLRIADGGETKYTMDSMVKYVNMIARIANCKHNIPESERELLKQAAYIRATLRNKLDGRYFQSGTAFALILAGLRNGVDAGTMYYSIRDVTSWAQFMRIMLHDENWNTI